jgi:uncharacterized lipoprotein YmbA
MRLVILVALLAGCASSQPARFYTLSAGAGPAVGSSAARTLVVGPVSLPELVDRPQLVRQSRAGEVTILEQQRWAEPLRVGVPRVVAENLAALLGGWRVSTREEALGRPDCRVALDVRRLEAGATVVRLETLWAVVCEDGRRLGRSVSEEAVDGAEPAAVVAAQGRALDSMSREIASALRGRR